MPLHIDYRPRSFDEVLGKSNKATINSLESKFEEGKAFPHVALFHGPSGCGKTTLARIVADMLGCAPPDTDGVANPDFTELNISDTRGIDTARNILSEMRYKPVNSECRIWLLDEVHQATKDFQNSLLKAFEDTPEHVYFLLCTTEPQKILGTIKTRASKFKVGKLTDDEVGGMLMGVIREEGMQNEISDDIIDGLVEKSDGSPREALVSLDQIIDLDPEKMADALKASSIEEAQTIELCRALIKNRPWKEVSKLLKDLENADIERLRQGVIGYARACVINGNKNDDAAVIFEEFKEPFWNNGKAGLAFACYNLCFPLT